MIPNDDGPTPRSVGAAGEPGRSKRHQGTDDERDCSRQSGGGVPHRRCPDCLAAPGAQPGAPFVHQYGCPTDATDRAGRRSDVEALALAGPGAVVRRELRPAERAELALRRGRAVSRSEGRRRWRVAVRQLADGRRERAFLLDGQAVALSADWFVPDPVS